MARLDPTRKTDKHRKRAWRCRVVALAFLAVGAAVVASGAAGPAPATDVCVAVDGRNAAPGAREGPSATLGRARDCVIENCRFLGVGGDLAKAAGPLTPKGPWADWQAAGYDRHSLIADPLFVDPAHDDYRLRPDSSALQLGFKPIVVERIGSAGYTEPSPGAERQGR